MSDILVVTSKVKQIVKEKGLRTSESFVIALSERVARLTEQAVETAKTTAPERKTLMAEDLGG